MSTAATFSPENRLPQPEPPQSLAELGIPPTLVEQILIKMLYFRGELFGSDLASQMGVWFSLLNELLQGLKLQHLVQVRRSLGIGEISAVYSLTEAGRLRAQEAMEQNQYTGPVPVPLAQYAAVVRSQCRRAGWLTREALVQVYGNIVISPWMVRQIGPALNSGNSLLVFGNPGNGKTVTIEALANLESEPVAIPYAIECQGNIIQVFDPVFHRKVDAVEETSVMEGHDGRWARCRRPFIVSGGELNLEMLDLSYNPVGKTYEAPLQLKANNGIYLIDDFGRQKVTPAEVLNRWIIPMERKVDYLHFCTGAKMTAPFETFLVFSTNLDPKSLGDEAFLRRIHYKLSVKDPDEAEFREIFRRACETSSLAYPGELVERLLRERYAEPGRPFRRCHPRDIVGHALDLIHFEKLSMELTWDVLDRAFESCLCF